MNQFDDNDEASRRKLQGDRGKILYFDSLFRHKKTIGEIVFYQSLLFMWTFAIIVIIYFWDINYIRVYLLIFPILGAGMIYFIFKSYTFIIMYDYRIYEKGFIIPAKRGRYKPQEGFIAFTDIQDIKFFHYGMTVCLYMKNGKEILIQYEDANEPYRIIVDMLIKHFNLKDYPDFNHLNNWDRYLSNSERQKAIHLHMEQNKRFL